MQVTLRLGGGLGGQAWWPPQEVEVEEGATLAVLLDRLGERTRADLEHINAIIIVNGCRVDRTEAWSLALQDGDVVAVFAVSAGG